MVRRIRPHEEAALRNLRLAALSEAPSAFGSTYAAEALLTTADWSERGQGRRARHERLSFAVTEDDDIVGLVGGYRSDAKSPRVELVSMWTHPTVRRMGIGRLLVNAVLDWARTCGAQCVELWVTRGNVGAENLYRQMGFVDTGDYQPLPSDPCKDELRMRVSL